MNDWIEIFLRPPSRKTVLQLKSRKLCRQFKKDSVGPLKRTTANSDDSSTLEENDRDRVVVAATVDVELAALAQAAEDCI